MPKKTKLRRSWLAFGLSVVVAASALTASIGVTGAAGSGGNGQDESGWKPADALYEDGNLILHKNIVSSSGSQEEGNLTYRIQLGVQSKKNIVTTSTPLDIVLVLDRSGSMKEMLGDSYQAITSAPDKDEGYYILINGEYQRVRWRDRKGSSDDGWYIYSDRDWGSRVYYQHGGTGTDGYYEFYERQVVSRMDALKEAAKQFVNDVAAQKGDHRLALVSYSSDYGSSEELINHTDGLDPLKTQEQANTINGYIDGLVADGGTYTNAGLTEAVDIFNQQSPEESAGRKRVVILFTDGEPTGNNTSWDGNAPWDNLAENGALDAAKALKASKDQNVWIQTGYGWNNGVWRKGCDATVYSIGMFQNPSNDVKTFLTNIASPSVADDPSTSEVDESRQYYFNCYDTEELKKIFDKITEDIGTSLNQAQIIDYIDPAFKLTEASIDSLKARYGEDAVGYDEEKGLWYVKIVDDIVPSDNMTMYPEGDAFIEVTPKDRELTGDNLPTNDDDSGLYPQGADETTWKFPEPTVKIDDLKQALSQNKTATVKAGEGQDNPDRLYDITLTLKNDKDKAVKNLTVRDYIDQRFDIVDGSGNVVASGTVAGGTVKYDEEKKAYYVEWTGVEVPANGTWDRVIPVKAKEAFLGGNDVPTNLPDVSGVYAGNDAPTWEFAEPTVNVPVQLQVGDQEETIFLGETIPATGLPEKMFDANQDWFLTQYGKAPTGMLSLTWTDESGKEVTLDEIKALTPSETVHFYLTVNFVPKTDGTVSQKTGGGKPVETPTTDQGTYTVNIKRGEITVNKVIHQEQTWLAHGDPIFIFRLERLEDGKVVETRYEHVRFTDATTEKLSATFDGLQEGTYRLTELDVIRYDFKSCKADTANGKVDGESILFTIDSDSPSGEATFTNNKVEDKYFTHTDISNNQFNITFPNSAN